MRTFTVISLLVLMVSIQTPVGQLFKLPLLIEHFIEHQKQEGLSLFAFLYEHYSKVHNDADLPDGQLPFKNITFYTIGYAIVPFFRHNPVEYLKESKQHFPGYNFTYTSAFLSAIWQPPRSCQSLFELSNEHTHLPFV